MKRNLFLLVMWSLLCSCGSKMNNGVSVLIDETLVLRDNVDSLNEIFGDRYKLTPLEYSEKSMVGILNKIIKREGVYYVMSGDYAGGKEVLVFDREGRYLSKLSRLGRGPGEYLSIGDFEVHPNGGRTELWICSRDKMMIYDCENWQLIREMTFPFMINKFKRFPDNTLLLMTGQSDESLTLVDQQGKILNTYLSKSVPFLSMRPVQFIPYEDRVLFPLGVSNDFVSYDWRKKEFGRGQFVRNNNMLSANQLSDLYQEWGEDYPIELKNKTYVGNVRYYNEKLFLTFYDAGDRYLLVYNDDSRTIQCCMFSPKSKVPNNINGTNNLNFISYMIYGDSDDSLLMVMESESDDINQVPNPAILEYF